MVSIPWGGTVPRGWAECAAVTSGPCGGLKHLLLSRPTDHHIRLLLSPGTGPSSLLRLFPRTALSLVPVSKEMIQLTRQSTQGSSVAPSHRALLLHLELAASGGCREGTRWCVIWGRHGTRHSGRPRSGWVGAGQGEGQKASSASLLTRAPEHPPGTLGSALAIIDYRLCRGLSGRDWIKNWLRPMRREVLQSVSEKSFPLGIPGSHL